MPCASKVSKQLGVNINYTAGPLSLGLAYDQQHGVTVVTASDTDKCLLLAVRYEVVKTSWIAGYQRRENDLLVVDQETDLRSVARVVYMHQARVRSARHDDCC